MTDADPAVVTWGTFAVAIYGVAQPWLLATIKRLRTRREIVIAETLRPEFFFALPTGPAVGLYGTIFNNSEKSSVKTIKLDVTRVANGERHLFEMRTFRRNSFAQANDGSFATPFMIEADTAYVYNITFHEQRMTIEFEDIARNFKNGWAEHVRAQMPANLANSGNSALINTRVVEIFNAMNGRYPAWYMTAFNALNRMFFWREGEWLLTMSVVVLGDSKLYSHSWRTIITQADETQLLQNTTQILRSWAGQPAMLPNFASPDYLKS